MIRKLYSIRDAKAELYNPPFHASTPGEAERAFTELANSPGHFVNKFPEDYDLFFVASFDDNTGKLEVPVSPEHIVKAIQVKKDQAGH